MASELTVAPYSDEDRAGVIELLQRSLGGGPAGAWSPEFFDWKHMKNPFGRSFLIVARDGQRIVGLRAFMRWEFSSGSTILRCVRAVDTSTDPDYQGRGIFTRLTTEALDRLQGEIDVVFNTPNDKSLPGYLKMGWRVLGTVRPSVRLRSPLRFATTRAGARGSARSPSSDASEATAEMERIDPDELLAHANRSPGRFETVRTPAYVMWRYSAPGLDYRAVSDSSYGKTTGICLFRLRERGTLAEATIGDVVVKNGDRATARTLLKRAAAASRVDHLTALFPPESAAAAAATRSGFVRGPRGMTVVVNPRRDDLPPSIADPSAWAFSLGDLEVF